MKNVRLNYKGETLFFTGIKSVQFMDIGGEMNSQSVKGLRDFVNC